MPVVLNVELRMPRPGVSRARLTSPVLNPGRRLERPVYLTVLAPCAGVAILPGLGRGVFIAEAGGLKLYLEVLLK
ncbi:MAG: hypothetical protein DRJ97_02615 [Thermoprotei archaeon]|nr:MAG: hypothetical protein DRJ97_02615 [Thermoprotei archaeon]